MMTYSSGFSNTPAARVLKAIQLRGLATVKDVAQDLGVTTSAVRLHLAQLEANGAIRADKVREGVGRPYHVYSVTAQGHNLFHKDYGELTRFLLEEVAETQGPDALQEVLDRLGSRLADLYRHQVWGQELADRLAAWAELLERRGVLVRVKEAGEGYLLQQYGCPYHNLAIENRAVCEVGRQVMVHLLESDVELSQCVLDGHHSCQFTISETGD